MPRNSTRFEPKEVKQVAVVLTTSFQDLVTGSEFDSVITSITASNANSTTAKEVTFANAGDAVLCTIQAAANAGNSSSAPALDALTSGLVAGSEFANPNKVVYYLEATKKLRAKVDSVSGGSVTIFVTYMNF